MEPLGPPLHLWAWIAVRHGHLGVKKDGIAVADHPRVQLTGSDQPIASGLVVVEQADEATALVAVFITNRL